jgi:hypothetical protein
MKLDCEAFLIVLFNRTVAYRLCLLVTPISVCLVCRPCYLVITVLSRAYTYNAPTNKNEIRAFVV